VQFLKAVSLSDAHSARQGRSCKSREGEALWNESLFSRIDGTQIAKAVDPFDLSRSRQGVRVGNIEIQACCTTLGSRYE